MAKRNSEGDKNIINNHTSLVQELEKGEHITPCVDVNKAKIQSDGSIDKLNLRLWLEDIYKILNYLGLIGHQLPP